MVVGDREEEPMVAFAHVQATSARFLMDLSPEQEIAFTAVVVDLSAHDASHGERYDAGRDELQGQSTRFATSLATLGVAHGDRVGTLMGACPQLLVAMLGIWRLGAVQVPLSTADSHDDIDIQLRASQAKLVICDADQRPKLVPTGVIPNDASTPVVVARGEAFGYDASFSEMVEGHGAFAELNADTMGKD